MALLMTSHGLKARARELLRDPIGDLTAQDRRGDGTLMTAAATSVSLLGTSLVLSNLRKGRRIADVACAGGGGALMLLGTKRWHAAAGFGMFSAAVWDFVTKR